MEMQVRANHGQGRSRELRGKEVQAPPALKKKDAAALAQEICTDAVHAIVMARKKGEAHVAKPVDFPSRCMPKARWFAPMLEDVEKRLKSRIRGRTFKVAFATQFLTDDNVCRVTISADW